MQRNFERDRRRCPRIFVDFPVILWRGRNRLRCLSRQLSEFGMFVASAQLRLVGERLRIEFPLGSPVPALAISGTVAYALEDGMGIRFHDMGIAQRLALQSYVESSGFESLA